MVDSGTPLLALVRSRPAFGGTSEAAELADIIETKLGNGRLSWLEVGAGDGANLGFLLDRLTFGREIDVVAIEPAAVPTLDRENVCWIRGRIEDYTVNRTFDWINVRHSAYYMDQAVEELSRLARMLSAGGTMALTHWSRDCVLHRIHEHVTGDPRDRACAGIEDIAMWLRCDVRLTVSAPAFFESRLDVDRLLGDRELRDALLGLARRQRPLLAAEDPDPLPYLLRTMPAPDIRRNGIILVQAAGG